MHILRAWFLCLLPAIAASLAASPLEPPSVQPRSGIRHALVGATVHVKPGTILSNATIILESGRIVSVQQATNLPSGTRIHDCKSRIVYAGFIDSLMPAQGAESNKPSGSTQESSPGQDSPNMASGVANFLGVDGSSQTALGTSVGGGPAANRAHHRVIDGLLPDSASRKSARELGFTAGNVVPSKGVFRGQSTLLNLGDGPATESVIIPSALQVVSAEINSEASGNYPSSIMGAIALIRQTCIDAKHFAGVEMGTNMSRASRRFSPWLDALRPVVERKQRVLFQSGSPLINHTLAKVQREFGLEAILVASGQEWRRTDLLATLRTPLIVPLAFPELIKMIDDADWDDLSLDQLRAWDWAPENPAVIRKAGLDVAVTPFGLGDRKKFWPNLRLCGSRGFTESDALAALTTVPAKLLAAEKDLGTVEPGRLANLTVMDGPGLLDAKSQVSGVWILGEYYPQDIAVPRKEDPTNSSPAKVDQRTQRTARDPQAGRGPNVSSPNLLVRGATLWTSAMQGRMSNADFLVVGGKIKAIGHKINPNGFGISNPDIIDAKGRHITAGLIDAHNHSMILGGVNEASLPSTAMVRVEDVINSESANIRLQLAGGLTTANQLHGSANPVGGQSAVIKLKDGLPPDSLLLQGAPPGIKFALGENVKQSNWGESKTTRYPQTRMGVRAFLQNRFLAAREYLDAQKKSGGKDFRVDLELKALGEILEGKRWIHCHSYRQDEILMFLRLMEEFGVKVGTLQHVLEGYKVADEIAAHGAGGSTFADWWGYKFEVYDAIPFNGSLMHQRGVLVSINSDSSDHARRLNTEAAKAVKYGETSEEQALNFVTINAARQLRIDARTGSLEVGKDADFVVWSGPPLSSSSRCLQTWIEGRKYFDNDSESIRMDQLAAERASLLAKARKMVGEGKVADPSSPEAKRLFQRSLEHAYDGVNRHCLDEDHENGGAE